MRLLSDLVGEDIRTAHLPLGWQGVVINGITADSRHVQEGWLFVAMPGVRQDGRRYIAQAVAQGAVAILTDILPDDVSPPEVPVLYSDNLRYSVALLAGRFYHRQQPQWVAAITGTDGKTSTAHFYQQLWRLMGQEAASIGTLGVVTSRQLAPFPAVNTTPDPMVLHAALAELARHEVRHVAVEASSHGLDQQRLDAVRIHAAGFTNLTRDHLDYHQTEERYFAAKLRLFTEVMQPDGVAVLNADEAHYPQLKAACEARGVKVYGYGRNGDMLRLLTIEPHAQGQNVTLELGGFKAELDIPLMGGFQVMNILCAAGLALAEGAHADALLASIGRLEGVTGRMEQVAVRENGAAVFVDYAHTPGGLESVLTHIRPHVSARLLVVFGCGGDRDRGKRPQMGEIAARLADVAYVTDDNPRSEVPADIRAQVMAGCPDAIEVDGRGAAIEQAVQALQKGDVLVIAGKGHEQGQQIGEVLHPFDDAQVARQAVMRADETLR